MTQRRRQRGATFVGYSIGLMALLTGLLAPVFEGGKSAVDMLADSMKQEHSGYRYAVSTLRLSNDMGDGSGGSGSGTGTGTESGDNGGTGHGAGGGGGGDEDSRNGGAGDEEERGAGNDNGDEDEQDNGPLPLTKEITCETTYNSGDGAAEREEDKGFWGSMWDSVKNATTHVYDFVKGFWEGIKQQVGDIIDAVTEPVETLKGLYELAKQLINEPAATLKAIGEALGQDFSILTQCGPYDQGVIVGQYANPVFMVKLVSKLAKFDDLKVAIRKTKDDFGCASFSAGTPVWLADGRGPIDKLIKGQLVQSRHDATFGDQAQAINYTFGRTADHYYALTTEFETFHVTGEHPFWLQGKGWTEVKDLKRGDPIATATGDVLVLQNQRVDQPLEVYNFSVAHTPSYFVGEGGVWVHNAACLVAFEKSGKNKELNNPKANTTYYVDGQHVFTTDSKGRTQNVKTVITEGTLDKDLRDCYRTQKVGNCGISDDDGGHLIANKLGGPGEEINLVPQNSNLNRGKWKKMENAWAKAAAEGKRVEVEIEVIYSGDGKRPDEFIVYSKIDGVPQRDESFKNEAGG